MQEEDGQMDWNNFDNFDRNTSSSKKRDLQNAADGFKKKLKQENKFSIGQGRTKIDFKNVNIYQKECSKPAGGEVNSECPNVEPLVDNIYQESGITHKKIDNLYPTMVIDTPYNRSVSGLYSMKNRKS